jgi:hypothetical protein
MQILYQIMPNLNQVMQNSMLISRRRIEEKKRDEHNKKDDDEGKRCTILLKFILK